MRPQALQRVHAHVVAAPSHPPWAEKHALSVYAVVVDTASAARLTRPRRVPNLTMSGFQGTSSHSVDESTLTVHG